MPHLFNDHSVKRKLPRNQYTKVIEPDYINPIICRVIKKTRFGRIVEVRGLIETRRFDFKNNPLPDPYFVAHSWNDEDHLSWHFEGFFSSALDAETYLENL